MPVHDAGAARLDRSDRYRTRFTRGPHLPEYLGRAIARHDQDETDSHVERAQHVFSRDSARRLKPVEDGWNLPRRRIDGGVHPLGNYRS